jgi:GTP-binding protein
MSDHWENVTDNVEALDMVIENVPAPKVSEGTPQMLTSLDFSIYRSYRYRSFREGVLKEGMPISLVKRWYNIKTRIKELHTFEGLGQSYILLRYCAIG